MADHKCNNLSDLDMDDGRPRPHTSAVMFSAAVVGNIVALVLLEVRRRTTSPSLYHVLATALLMTDLLGNIAVSPVVLTAYAQGKTLVGMSSGGELCAYFGFSMTFLCLCTLALLWLLAVERYVSIGHPYFYERHLSKRCGYITISVVYLSSVIFSLSGFGQYVQYCPGTWCFLKMSHAEGNYTVYIGFYASFILILTSSTVVCNMCVIFHLVVMHRRHKKLRGRAFARSQYRRSLSMTEEVEHLLPLAVITVVFICCTFPIVQLRPCRPNSFYLSICEDNPKRFFPVEGAWCISCRREVWRGFLLS
ncbi:prostaglandin E2 receptor EP2 subtype isoform X2 [Larimichthys crocea]|uniref:prostaglandin E2 receptor EP2 subtype isoform X2 n=1 Tax=Larimichthys crocea TaxID=215358 RepID=UPI000F5EE81B|nr:prostaglandin E2 receptor EP2 subtype isoform X2 [Larimichthys crocea]